MEQQLKFIREVAGPMGYIWISSVASPLWSMEVEYCVDNDKLKFSVRDKDTLTEAVEEMYDKIVRISSRLPSTISASRSNTTKHLICRSLTSTMKFHSKDQL